jgi:hypothetical protein
MNIEKVKNYNHKILALLGTVILLLAIVSLIFFIYFVISEIGRSTSHNNHDDGILSDDKIEELQQEKKRQQLISYEIPRLIDTLNLVYIIPVSHKTLRSAEYITDNISTKNEDMNSLVVKERNLSQYYGDYNNLLIYDFKNSIVKKLFKDRVNFGNIRTEYFKDDILILIEASSNDTYKDGVINLIDFKSLYIYSLKDKELKTINWENADISQILFIENSKDLLIKFGIDQNKDGKYDELYEPSLIKKFNFTTDELSNVVDETIDKELQKKLEGTKE